MSVNTITGFISAFINAQNVTMTVDTAHGGPYGTTGNRWCRYVFGSDDTPKLMAAYAAAAAAGGGIVYHPPGKYCTFSMSTTRGP